MFCDKVILGELSGIVNPTLRERIGKSIVGKLIKGKGNSGWVNLLKNLKLTNKIAEEL